MRRVILAVSALLPRSGTTQRSPIVFALCLALLGQAVAMAPVNQALPDHVRQAAALPDPPARPKMPPDVLASQRKLEHTGGNAVERTPNHVPKFTPEEVTALAQEGATVVVNEEGHVEFDVAHDGGRTRIALWDTKSHSGLKVIGLGFLNEAEIQELDAARAKNWTVFSGPQSATGHTAPYDHTHPLGWPFHSCSYLFMYAGSSRDAYVHLCPADVSNVRWVGGAMAATIGVVSRSPLLALLGFIAINTAISYFLQSDGSMRIYVPGSSTNNSYGYVYWYSRYTYWKDWYWYYNYGNPYYCWARKYSNGYRYYVCDR